MLHCEKYVAHKDEYEKPIPLTEVSRPENSNEIFNIRVTISSEEGDALILLSPDSYPTESTVSYEIKLNSSRSLCQIRLQYNGGFAIIGNSKCRLPDYKSTTIYIIGKTNGMLSIYSEGQITALLETNLADPSPLKKINYVFFSALDDKENMFYYNCYDRLKECKTYTSLEKGYREYFPIEDVSTIGAANVVVNITFTVWSKHGDAHAQLSFIRHPNQHNPAIELVIAAGTKEECFIRTTHEGDIFFVRVCPHGLSSTEPVDVTLTITTDQNLTLKLSGRNGTKIIKGKITQEIIPLNYISFGLQNYFAKYFFSCSKHKEQNCKSFEISGGNGEYLPIEEFSNIQRDDELINVNLDILAKDGAVAILLSPSMEPDEKTLLFAITIANSSCSYQTRRLRQSSTLWYTNHCTPLSKKNPVDFKFVLNKSGFAKVYLDETLVITATEVPKNIKYLVLGTPVGRSAKFVYDCPN